MNTAIENAAEDDEAAAVVRGHLARLEQCMATALRNARDTGEVRASVDPVAAPSCWSRRVRG